MTCVNTDHYYSLCDLTVSVILNPDFFFDSVPFLRETEKQFFTNTGICKQVFKSLTSSIKNVLQRTKARQLFVYSVSYCINISTGATENAGYGLLNH